MPFSLGAPRAAAVAAALVALLAAVPCRGQAPSVPPVTIRGTVADSAGEPVPGVAVQVTRFPQNDGRLTNADALGSFAVSFADGDATEYYVLVSGPGWRPFRTRLVPDPANPRWGRLSVRLTAAEPVVLNPVTVRAARPPAARESSLAPPVGGGEAAVEGVSAALSPTEAGDLEAMAATLPGFLATGGGFSALGLDPAQNRVTLNGLDFAGGAVPRDLQVRARVATSAYDPARGGFSGAQMMLDVAPGSAFTLGNASLSAGGAPLLLGGEAARTGGPRTDFRAGAARQGELVPERLFYNAGFQADRRLRDAPSLTTASPAALEGAGMDPAAAGELARVLAALGIPATARGRTVSPSDDLLLMGRLDRTPYGATTWSVGGFARVGQTAAAAPGIFATEASGTRSAWRDVMAHAEHSTVVGPRHRNDLRTALSLTSRTSRPLVELPAGTVDVPGITPGSATSLRFGGATAESDVRRWSWQVVNETRWSARGERHQLKLHVESLLEGYRRADLGATRGTFVFRSLDDLAGGRPASYHRRLAGTRAEGAQWHGALALGDTWRVSGRLRLMGGVRVDADRFLDAPPLNPVVAARFGTRNDVVPGGIALSPRLGFSWAPRSAFPNPGLRITSLGTRAETPVGLLRGGVGVFRGRVPVEAVVGPLLATGLQGGAEELRCIGPAAPVPDWAAYAAGALPVSCAGGGAFADSAPAVELFAAGYRPPRSVRANLAWSSRRGWLAYGIEAVYSANLDQPGVVDLNFSGMPGFTLADEGGRAVFAAPGQVAPESGIPAPAAARRFEELGPVLARTSDLRSDSRQVTLTLAPELPGRYWLGFGYTLASTQARFRGFDGAAFGDPRVVERAPGRWDARHQIHAQAGASWGSYSVALYARTHSGLPYTPLVAGDVNGDGRWGDRAFVFDPAAVAEPLAEGMRRLLDDAPEAARRCLLDQLGRPAERGSCSGPWTQHANLRLAYQPAAMRGGSLRERTSAAVAIENPLGGIDRLLHGDDGLRGWGGALAPDPVLYRVEGFDAEAGAFRYAVNPDFGRVRAAQAASTAPFRVTLQLGVRLGAPVARQQLQLYLRPGRATAGERPSAESIQRRYARNVPDVYARTLAMADSLVLTGAQVEALRAAQVSYRARVDSVWAELAGRLAALPERYDAREAVRWQEEATDRVWDINRGEAETLRGILTPFQLQMADWSVRDSLGGIRAMRPRIWRQ